MADDPLSQTKTSLHRRWVLKMALITLAGILVGFWGLYDAKIKYPERGARHAEYMEWQYLQAERDAAGLSLAGEADPEAALAQLGARSPAYFTNNPADEAKLGWLRSLKTIGRLEPAHTTYGGERSSPADRLRELTEKWNTSSAPKALAAFDLPLQWGFCIGGFLLAGAMVALFAKVASKTYRWDPQAKALTLPGGAALAPEDIADIDKRKWHKFMVTIRVAAGHGSLGGKDIKLDLYRYTPLEEWVLELERIRFPDRAETATEAPQRAEAEEPGADGAPAPAGVAAAGAGEQPGEPGGPESEQSDGSPAERKGDGA